MRRSLLLFALALAAMRAEIIDRIAVTLDNRVVTESDLVREIRLAAFYDGAKPEFSGPARRRAAERMVERAIIGREMVVSRYPLPPPAAAGPVLAQFRKARFPDDRAFAPALAQYRLTLAELRDYLLAQLTVLRFIEFRFRPSVQVTEDEIKDYFGKRFPPSTRLDAVHDQIEKTLTDEKTDRVLDTWMKEARARTRIVFREQVFQ